LAWAYPGGRRVPKIFFPWPSCRERGHGQGATVFQGEGVKDTSKNQKGLVEKTETRLVPGMAICTVEMIWTQIVNKS
jgi:hypothetical protein